MRLRTRLRFHADGTRHPNPLGVYNEAFFPDSGKGLTLPTHDGTPRDPFAMMCLQRNGQEIGIVDSLLAATALANIWSWSFATCVILNALKIWSSRTGSTFNSHAHDKDGLPSSGFFFGATST